MGAAGNHVRCNGLVRARQDASGRALTNPLQAHVIAAAPIGLGSGCGKGLSLISTRRTRGKSVKWPKLRELKEDGQSSGGGALHLSFPKEPHSSPSEISGPVQFNEKNAWDAWPVKRSGPVGRHCHEDRIDDGKAMRTMIHYSDTCIFCAKCETIASPTMKASRHRTNGSLSFFDRKTQSFETIQKSSSSARSCGTVINGQGPSEVDCREAGGTRLFEPDPSTNLACRILE